MSDHKVRKGKPASNPGPGKPVSPALQSQRQPGSGAPRKRGVPTAESAPPAGPGSPLPTLCAGAGNGRGEPRRGGKGDSKEGLATRVAPFLGGLSARREGRGAGVWEEGTGGTHVDRQRPRVDGGLGPHGRLQPQLQLLPQVFARGPRTRLVWRLGAGQAGGRLRGGGLAWASASAAAAAAAAALPSAPRLPLCAHRPGTSSAAANSGQREASTMSQGPAEPLTRGARAAVPVDSPALTHARTHERLRLPPATPTGPKWGPGETPRGLGWQVRLPPLTYRDTSPPPNNKTIIPH